MTRFLPALLLAAACGSTPPAEDAHAPAKAEPAEKAEPAKKAEPAEKAGARGDDADRASKNGKAKLKVGDAKVMVTYGRPKVRGRTVWGELVPYGKVWRTGADEATVISFSGDVKLGDTAVKAGSYALFTIPEKDKWTIVLNSVADQWGSYDYDEGKDVARAVVTPEKGEMTEDLTIAPDGDMLYIQWAQAKVPLPITAP